MSKKARKKPNTAAAIPDAHTIQAAFVVGFLSKLLVVRHNYCGNGLACVREAFDSFASDAAPSRVSELRRILLRLVAIDSKAQTRRGFQQELIRRQVAQKSATSRELKGGHRLATPADKWLQLATSFRTMVETLVAEKPAFQVWFELGQFLGQCLEASAGNAKFRAIRYGGQWQGRIDTTVDTSAGATARRITRHRRRAVRPQSLSPEFCELRERLQRLPAKFKDANPWIRVLDTWSPEDNGFILDADTLSDLSASQFFFDWPKVTVGSLFTKIKLAIMESPWHPTQTHAGKAATRGRIKPRWDDTNRRFLIDEKVVKEYRHTAANQTAVLQTFQDNGWARRVSNPLEKGRQTQETLRELRDIAPTQIRFRGDGTGTTLIWEPASSGEDNGGRT